MNEPRIDRIQRLFLEALEQPAKLRDSWLAEQCGTDAELLREIQTLLRHDEPSEDPLESPLKDAIGDANGLADPGSNSRVSETINAPKVKTKALHVRCPHCRNPVEIIEESSFKAIPCPTCGSSFSLIGEDETTEPFPNARQKLAHFELIELLGVGQFGSVWKAKDAELDRFVAIKIPRQTQLRKADVELFLREARTAAQLKHPNIVSVHEVGRDQNGVVFIASDLIEGANLKSWMQGQSLPPKEAAELCIKVAAAVHHAHESGVVHRDLKPSNIMMDLAGEPHIMDFGLAKRDSGEITMTADGAILGTPAYMSPEQAKGEGHTADRRSDIYSLGVILYELLTGELPFRGDKQMLIVQILTEEPPSPRKLSTKVSKDLATVCLKCLEKTPSRRYPTADDLVDDLNAILTARPINARPLSLPGRLLRLTRRKPAETGLMIMSLVATAAICTALVVYTYNSKLRSMYSIASSNRRLAEYAKQRAESARALADANATAAIDANRRIEPLFYIQAVASIDSLLNVVDQNIELLISDKTDEKRESRQKLIDSLLSRADALLVECPATQRRWEWNFFTRRLADLKVLDTNPEQGLSGDTIHSRIVCEEAKYGYGVAHGIDYSPDNERFVTASREGIKLWRVSDGKLLHELEDVQSFSGAVRFNRDGSLLAIGEAGGTLRVFNVNERVDQTLRPPGNLVHTYDVAWSSDGNSVAGGYFGITALIWDANNNQILQRFNDHRDYVMCVAFDPQGGKLATGSHDGMVRVWNTRTGEQISSFGYERISTIESLEFFPDGRRLAAGGRSHLSVWDVESGDEVLQLPGHDQMVTCLAVGPAGDRIVSGSLDRTVRIWDAKSGQQIAVLAEHSAPVSDVSFTSDGKMLASIDLGGMLIVRNGDSP